MTDKYKDIINYQNYEPNNHIRMSMSKRAAQFAPFAALTGYEDEVNEVGRITEKKRIISDDEIDKLENILNLLTEIIITKPKVAIVYFDKDNSKVGGSYKKYVGNIKKIDNIYKRLLFVNNFKVSLNDIIKINLIDNNIDRNMYNQD